MNATFLAERNIAFQRMIRCMALSELSFGGLSAATKEVAISQYLGGSSFALMILLTTLGVVMGLGSIINFANACSYQACARGYGKGWAVLSLMLASAVFIGLIYLTPYLDIPPQLSSFCVQIYPLISLGIGALPIVLLKDRYPVGNTLHEAKA